MNRSTYRHSYTMLTTEGTPREILGREQSIAHMYQGQRIARDMARNAMCDIRHEVYNDVLRRWEFLGVYHTDGTCTQWTGERKLFVENPSCPWADLPATTNS